MLENKPGELMEQDGISTTPRIHRDMNAMQP